SHAEEFFAHPSLAGLHKLLQAADRAGCKDPVQAAALRFLETGIRPSPATAAPSPLIDRQRASRSGRKATASQKPAPSSAADVWPLPLPVSPRPTPTARPGVPAAEPKPHYVVLLELAIEEKRPDDVLKWYDLLRTE